MFHFKRRDLDARRVVPLHLPPLCTHVSATEQVDGAVSFAHDDAMVYVALGVHGVESDVETVRWNPHDPNYFYVSTAPKSYTRAQLIVSGLNRERHDTLP